MSEPEVPLQNMALDFSAKDPVCGMTLEPLQARGKAQFGGETYFFCSPGCMHKFTASPAKYATPRQSPDSDATPVEAAPVPPPTAKKLAKDPVCGMSVDPAKAASTAEYDGKLYHFCSRSCGEKFRKDPARYLTVSSKPVGMTGMVQIGGGNVQIGASRRLEKDPVCGMNVDPSAAASTVSHIGKTYYFCCRGCAEKFQANPGKYLSTGSSTPSAPAKSSATRRATTSVRWIPKSGRSALDLVPSAVWRWSPRFRRVLQRRSGLVQCIQRSCVTDREHAQSAAWRSSRWQRAPAKKKIPSSAK